MIETATAMEARPDVFRLPLVGKLYANESKELEQKICEAVDAGARHLLLDCSQLQQMDSTIMRVLISGIRILRETSGGRVAFSSVNDYVSRLLVLTQIDKFTIIAPTEADALAKL